MACDSVWCLCVCELLGVDLVIGVVAPQPPCPRGPPSRPPRVNNTDQAYVCVGGGRVVLCVCCFGCACHYWFIYLFSFGAAAPQTPFARLSVWGGALPPPDLPGNGVAANSAHQTHRWIPLVVDQPTGNTDKTQLRKRPHPQWL